MSYALSKINRGLSVITTKILFFIQTRYWMLDSGYWIKNNKTFLLSSIKYPVSSIWLLSSKKFQSEMVVIHPKTPSNAWLASAPTSAWDKWPSPWFFGEDIQLRVGHFGFEQPHGDSSGDLHFAQK
jgi:hypothetical protein